MHAISLTLCFTQIITHRKILHPPRCQEALHHLLVITEQLSPAGALAHTGVDARSIFAIASKETGIYAVVGRGLVQPHEGVGITPVPAGRVVTVNDRHGRIRFRQQGVDKRHPNRTTANDEVIG